MHIHIKFNVSTNEWELVKEERIKIDTAPTFKEAQKKLHAYIQTTRK